MTLLQRRDFLKTAAASTLVALDLFPTARAAAPERVDVLVIGAGVAGLAAAQELKKQKKSVLVLEGRDRLGGRVWTDRSLKRIPIDLGAQWVHGFSKENPVAEIVKEQKIRTRVTTYEAKSLYNAEGKEFGAEAAKGVMGRYRKIMAAVRQERQALIRKGAKDESLQAGLDRAAAAEELTPHQKHLLAYAVNAEIEHEYAADAADLSLLHYEDDEETRGEDVMFRGGYDQVVRFLADGATVKLQHIVQQVEYSKDGVIVTTDRGAFQADRVVVTLPLGVLQANKIAFKPALPDAKLTAIRRLGMGVLNKVCLLFPKVFWPKEAEMLGYVGPKKGEWGEWYDLSRVTDEPLLMGFNAATFGRALEEKKDGAVIDGAMAVLRKLFGKDLASPDGALITRWAHDPFAGGSYSYLPPGATVDDRKQLAAPVDNRLFFAGEATSIKWPSTVHGALQSGVREAKRILALA